MFLSLWNLNRKVKEPHLFFYRFIQKLKKTLWRPFLLCKETHLGVSRRPAVGGTRFQSSHIKPDGHHCTYPSPWHLRPTAGSPEMFAWIHNTHHLCKNLTFGNSLSYWETITVVLFLWKWNCALALPRKLLTLTSRSPNCKLQLHRIPGHFVVVQHIYIASINFPRL